MGLVTALAGAVTRLGELGQPGTDPEALFIESWPHVAAFEPLGGEPAMTLIPVLTVSSFLALVPGLVLVRSWTAIDGTWLPALLTPAAFTGLVLTLLAALAHDRTASASPETER